MDSHSLNNDSRNNMKKPRPQPHALPLQSSGRLPRFELRDGAVWDQKPGRLMQPWEVVAALNERDAFIRDYANKQPQP